MTQYRFLRVLLVLVFLGVGTFSLLHAMPVAGGWEIAAAFIISLLGGR